METTSNVGQEPNVKPEDTVNTAVAQEEAQAQNESSEGVSIEEKEIVPESQPENLTEVLDSTEELTAPPPPPLSPDEQILDAWLNNGKTEVSMNELIQAGFDGEGLDTHTNIIGRFKLSRLLLVSPFKLERNLSAGLSTEINVKVDEAGA